MSDMTSQTKFSNDPLFQLNLLLWLTQPMPSISSIRPIFYEAGFEVYSLSPLLTLPPEIRDAVRQKNIRCQESARPDIIIHRAIKNGTYILMECKKNSFGVESSSAEQGRAYLLLTGPSVRQVLGLDPKESLKATVLYVTDSGVLNLLKDSLNQMAEELDRNNLKHGTYECLGLELRDSSVFLHMPEEFRQLLNTPTLSPVEVLKAEDGTDPRPLYFIIYDPGIDQDPEERKLCQRILFERIQGSLLMRIGQATPPCHLTFTNEDLLSDATFGMYKIWEDNSARRHMRSLTNGLISAIHRVLPDEVRQKFFFSEGEGWIIDIGSDEEQQMVLNLISRFKADAVTPSDLRQLTLDDAKEQ
jgi:hypothetical protein